MQPKRKHKKNKRGKRNRKNKILLRKAFMLGVIILMILLINNIIKGKDQEADSVETASITEEISNMIEKDIYANISRYIVYGTHLNLEGSIEFKVDNLIDNAQIVAKSSSDEEIIIDTEYEYDDNILSFSTIEEINTGLNLETLETKDYIILLKVKFSNNQTKYYSLSNNSEYGNIEYYTLTRNNINNKININFTTLNDIPILKLDITPVNDLPEEVYDVVIDPGHGGSDGGAVLGRYTESEIVLDCANELKKQLENIGLKVLLTRDGTESSEEDTVYNIYDEEGRVTIANESHAKILISLHLNSTEEDISDGGVEVYAPTNCDLTLAKSLADNIVEKANTEYSQMENCKEEEGVYVKTIKIKNTSYFRSYKGIFDDVPYLFIIREIGGIATGAYVDGKNGDYSENKYRYSNIGVEGYLIELGYINVNKDLNNILRNKNSYMEAITNSINEFYKIK